MPALPGLTGSLGGATGGGPVSGPGTTGADSLVGAAPGGTTAAGSGATGGSAGGFFPGMGGMGGFGGQGGGEGRQRQAWESEDSQTWDPEGPEMPAVGADGMIGGPGTPDPAVYQAGGFAPRSGPGRGLGETRGAAAGDRAAQAREERLRALMEARAAAWTDQTGSQRRKWMEEDPDAWGPEGFSANSVPTEPRHG
jgi:hypothetical protein